MNKKDRKLSRDNRRLRRNKRSLHAGEYGEGKTEDRQDHDRITKEQREKH